MTTSMKRSRKLLSIVIVFFWASEYCHVPYFTPYLTMLGFGASAIGIMAGTYGFTQMLVRIPLGIATDITSGYRYVVIMGTVFTTVSSFGLMFATSSVLIVFCRFLAGVAASTWLAFSVLYSAYYDPSEGVQAMTNINVFNNGGKLLAFVLGTIVATIWGYKWPLLISFLTGVVAVIFALQLKEVPIKKEPMKLTALAGTFCNPGVLVPAFFAIILQMVIQGTAFSFTSTVAEMLGASRMEIGINTSLFTVVQVLAGGWLGKHFTPKLGTTRSVGAGFFCLAASCGLVAIAPNIWFLFLAQIIGGVGNILLMSILMALAIKMVPVENKSTAMGLFQALYGIGMTAGPVLIGHLVDGCGYHAAYLLFAAVCLASLVLALVLLPMLERRGAKME
ncbi:MAG: MFS transporter [Clostridiales bacterium]|nr:MFS transporter [Clostridiales bacterium]